MQKTVTKIWSGRPYAPFFMDLALKATMINLKEIIPHKMSVNGVYWHNKMHDYFMDKNGFEELSQRLNRKAKDEPEEIRKLFLKAYESAKLLNTKSQNYRRDNIQSLSDEDIIKHIEDYATEFKRMYAYATMFNIMGYAEKNPLLENLENILAQKNITGTKAVEMMTRLTTVNLKLKTQDRKLRVVELAKMAKNKGYSTVESILINLGEEIVKIIEDYAWLSYDFCDNIETNEDKIAKEVSDLMNQDLEKIAAEIENYEEDRKADIESAQEELELTEKEIEQVAILRELGCYKWMRELEMLESAYNIKYLTDELARRWGWQTLYTKYLLEDEFVKASKDTALYRDTLLERLDDFLVVIDEERGVFSGAEAVKMYDDFTYEEMSEADLGDVVKGAVAFPGKAVGVVKIVNKINDMEKFVPGDILVSIATMPDLMPAITKAAAIVTDEGGITCHAAIVSRELKKPCIIGTKIATRVLHDGDEVEVDAENGVVRIL